MAAGVVTGPLVLSPIADRIPKLLAVDNVPRKSWSFRVTGGRVTAALSSLMVGSRTSATL